ncbi:MAG: hypothetical protein LLG04_08730 [Parachlamydia sp.]|nr:hypothetical protein [Parachlamydia sp.]
MIFRPLNREALLQVIAIEIKKVQQRLNKRQIYLTLDESAKSFLVDKGFQPEMGARPLRRTIEQYLEDPLAEKVLSHPEEGRRCLVVAEGDHLSFVDQEVFPITKEPKEQKQKVGA